MNRLTVPTGTGDTFCVAWFLWVHHNRIGLLHSFIRSPDIKEGPIRASRLAVDGLELLGATPGLYLPATALIGLAFLSSAGVLRGVACGTALVLLVSSRYNRLRGGSPAGRNVRVAYTRQPFSHLLSIRRAYMK